MDRIVRVYERARVHQMCRFEEPSGTIVFGWQREEEAYAYAPMVLKPVNRAQLQFVANMLRVWLQSSDDYPNPVERKKKMKQFMPLFFLEEAVVKSASSTFFPWTEVHDRAFEAIVNAGEWRAGYEWL